VSPQDVIIEGDDTPDVITENFPEVDQLTDVGTGPQGPIGPQGPAGSDAPTVHSGLTGLDANDHGAIYYTEAELDAFLAAKLAHTLGQLTAYRETVAVQTGLAGAVTIDYALGNVHKLTCTGDVTGLTLDNLPASGIAWSLTLLIVHPAGGSLWAPFGDGSVDFGKLGEPLLDITAAQVDVINLFGEDGAAQVRGAYLLGYSA